jgi:type VI secretion system protein ImpL
MAAQSAFTALEGSFADSGDSYLVLDLIDGPRRYLESYCRSESACILQQLWEEEVLGPLRSVRPDDRYQTLFNRDNGLVWRFVNGTAKPFVALNKNGYSTRGEYPLRKVFVSFLNEGSVRTTEFESAYLVSIESLPLEVNSDAATKPYTSVLELQCVDANTSLENTHYPRKQTFTWQPGVCGDTMITIGFPGFELIKRYAGPLGFAEFLDVFKTGSHQFTIDEFPAHRDLLAEQHIEWIKLSYKITGGAAVVERLADRREPLGVPETIVNCWAE